MLSRVILDTSLLYFKGISLDVFSGPMVYGTCYSPLKYKKDVEEIGFAGK